MDRGTRKNVVFVCGPCRSGSQVHEVFCQDVVHLLCEFRECSLDQRGGVCRHFSDDVQHAGGCGEEASERDSEDIGEENGSCEGSYGDVAGGERGKKLEVRWRAVVVESEGFGTRCWAGFEGFVGCEHTLADSDAEKDWLGSHSDNNWEIGEEYFVPEGVYGRESW